jgi:hypothetical protein
MIVNDPAQEQISDRAPNAINPCRGDRQAVSVLIDAIGDDLQANRIDLRFGHVLDHRVCSAIAATSQM